MDMARLALVILATACSLTGAFRTNRTYAAFRQGDSKSSHSIESHTSMARESEIVAINSTATGASTKDDACDNIPSGSDYDEMRQACKDAESGHCLSSGDLAGYGCKVGCNCQFYQSCNSPADEETTWKTVTRMATDPEYAAQRTLGRCAVAIWVWILLGVLVVAGIGGGVAKSRQPRVRMIG